MAKEKKAADPKPETETPAGCTPKKVAVELLPKNHEMYGWFAKVVENTGAFDHLKDANVAFFWRTGWRKTPDRPVRMVHVMRMSDTVRALTGNAKGLHGVDFVVFLNHEEFQKADVVTPKIRDAWLDYAACHMGRAYNRQGKPAEDELKRAVWRVVKPELVFAECIQRRGAFHEESKQIARAIENYKQAPLWEDESPSKTYEAMTPAEKVEKGPAGEKPRPKSGNGRPRADA